MSTPPGRPAPSTDEDSGVHQGFYEHSTGGKIPLVPPGMSAPPSKRPSAWRRLLSWLGFRGR